LGFCKDSDTFIRGPVTDYFSKRRKKGITFSIVNIRPRLSAVTPGLMPLTMELATGDHRDSGAD